MSQVVEVGGGGKEGTSYASSHAAATCVHVLHVCTLEVQPGETRAEGGGGARKG